MLWLKTDSEWKRHQKVRALGRAGDQIGANARLLFLMVGSICNDQRPNSGIITPEIIDEAVFLSGIPGDTVDEAIARLVKVGLWHDDKAVGRCKTPHSKWEPVTCREAIGRKLKAGEYAFHHWFDSQLATDRQENPIDRQRERRRKALHRNPHLKQAIRMRDRDVCQYCGVITLWSNDRKSLRVGWFDHVDPFLDLDGPTMGNTVENLVVSCKWCNSHKKDRTPEQWRAESPAEWTEDADGRWWRTRPADLDPPDPDQGQIKTAIQTGSLTGSSSDPDASSPSRARRDRSGSGPDRITDHDPDRIQIGAAPEGGAGTRTGPKGKRSDQ